MRAWEPTRAAAHARLAAFLPAAGAVYARERNFDHGPDQRASVSALSPWIRHDVLGEQDVLAAVLAQHDARAAEKYIQEVLWRGYFKGWLEHRPGVWDTYCEARDTQIAALARNAGLRHAYDQAVAGTTGIAAFDHWAQELVETGYLHNHARMWFASIWIFTLGLSWVLGADFFYRHLLDGDPASNTCSWRWVAGLHTPGKHYLARADNIAKFTGGRFDPVGQLNETADPLAEDNTNPDPEALDLALPTRALGDAGWLITPDSPAEAGNLGDGPGLGLAMPALRSPLALGEAAAAFEIAALKQRCDAVISPGSVEDAEEQVGAWVRTNGLEIVALPHIVTGPYRALQPRLDAAIRSAGAQPVHSSRRYDRTVWPHAAKGFFKLKQKIPAILSTLDLG